MTKAGVEVYSGPARMLHWIVAVLIFVQVFGGLTMVWYASSTNFAAPSSQMYDAHKLGGLLILALVVARFAYRLHNGAPADEPTLEPWQKSISHLTHWGLYGLLFAVPLCGWLAASYFGEFMPFGIKLPALAGKDPASADQMFRLHQILAFVLIGLISMHITAAIYHHTVRKDSVLRRMLPRKSDMK
jgi:cytochrome b561